MHSFLRALEIQRWDDHRYYHHSRINQSLHLLSALSFLAAYVTIFKNPAASALIAWLVAMVSRQVGHFFFEPKGYDAVNRATHEHKENIKVGYNLRRKIVLLSIWALSPGRALAGSDAAWGFSAPVQPGWLYSAYGADLVGNRIRCSIVPGRAADGYKGRANRACLANEDRHGSVS